VGEIFVSGGSASVREDVLALGMNGDVLEPVAAVRSIHRHAAHQNLLKGGRDEGEGGLGGERRSRGRKECENLFLFFSTVLFMPMVVV